MTSAYPMPSDVLAEKVAALAAELGELPSKRRVMRTFRCGAVRANGALAELRRTGFERVHDGHPFQGAGAQPEHGQEQHAVPAPRAASTASDEVAEVGTAGAEIAVEALVEDVAGAVHPTRVRTVPRWPLLIIALGAFVAIWSGWVGLGKLTGFGPVVLLPGIADEWVINSAITLPLGVECYGALAMWAWLSDAPVSARARRFARWSALGSLALGALGQVAYHLMTAAGMTVAPWPITAFVSCLPVAVLGSGAALIHMIHRQEAS